MGKVHGVADCVSRGCLYEVEPNEHLLFLCFNIQSLLLCLSIFQPRLGNLRCPDTTAGLGLVSYCLAQAILPQ